MANKAAAAKPDKPKAARSEKKGGGQTLTWKGVKLKLPAADKIPGSVLFDFYAIEESNENLASIIGLIESFIGPEQLRWVRQQIASEALSIDDTIEAVGDLLGAIFEKYGMTPGEAQASQGS